MFFDDLLDNIQSSAEEAFSNFGSDALQGGLQQFGFIQTGAPPKTNPTAAQVQTGQRGQPTQTVITPRPSAETNQLKNGFGFSFGENGIGAMTPAIIVAAFVGLALLLRRK
tara:strand:+ start:6919 stop:7251 length:333 start_codon:yes stop_codon:yes gene_type:complete